MIRKTILEMISLLLLALCLALLHHSLSSSGITIFKKRPSGAPPLTSSVVLPGETAHGG